MTTDGEIFSTDAGDEICFENIDDTILDEDNLQEVKEAVIKLAAKACSLGLALGLKASDLDNIRSRYSDPDEILTEVLQRWLKQTHNVKTYGYPSWRSLAKAVNKPAGGRDHALAKKLATTHPLKNMEPPSKKQRKSEEENTHNGVMREKKSVQYGEVTYKFVEAVPNYLKCKKCQKLPTDPHRAVCQRSLLFCKSCLQHHQRNCSSCATDPDSSSKQQIEELMILCPNLDLDCEWEGQLGHVESHQSNCPKEMVACTYSDIGCKEKMLREKIPGHEDSNREKHLDYAMKTIKEMKETDKIIRQRMTDLEDLYRKGLEERKEEYEGKIQRLRDEIAQCPPLIVRMLPVPNHDAEILSVSEVTFHTTLFMSSSFYSHPQGYKMCILLKCCGSSSDKKSPMTVKLKVAALYQPQCSHTWPCKGEASISLQPGDKNPFCIKIDFDIASALSDTSIHHLSKEEGFVVCDIPSEWRDFAKPTSAYIYSITLKVEQIKLI